MNHSKNKVNIFGILFTIFIIIGLVMVVRKGIEVLKNISKICVVEEGFLKFEENSDGYILRDEKVLQGENYKNGMVQIILEGQRVGKDKPAFRYYSNGEDEILRQMNTLDDEINAAIESGGFTIWSTDIVNLEDQIEKVVDSMYRVNDLEEIQDKISELNTYIFKKTKIAGSLSPADSHIKTLMEKRNQLESKLSNASEVIYAPVSGTLSYRVDGLEEILQVTDFSYLNTEFLKSLHTKSSGMISTSSEKGKIINNFECYIACPMDTEKASTAKVGDEVTIRLPSADEVFAEIAYVVEEEDNKRVIVFKITDCVEKLIEYREIYIDIIWWNYKGLKVSNDAILEENDMSYVERSKAGYTDKIYVKILRQNDTYSIVENYTEEELKQLGFSEEKIKNRKQLNMYDEILLH